MPKPPELTLLARDDFKTGDCGWTTAAGVTKLSTLLPADRRGVPAGRHGRFIEISPEPDVHLVQRFISSHTFSLVRKPHV